ncbi:MAG: hypothetical protein CM1200mP41_34820 [Gammaproteobacteria bacterium]|nr:MAG: hypothetical protein CM1200mP41_34820 [Gammaproteobacteria bacterium]
MMDGIAVYKSRLRMGEKLGHRVAQEWPDHDIDVSFLCPTPVAQRLCKWLMSLILNTEKVLSRTAISGERFLCRAGAAGAINPSQTECD